MLLGILFLVQFDFSATQHSNPEDVLRTFAREYETVSARTGRFLIPFNFHAPGLNYLTQESDLNESEYDFVVIGAGSSGATLAARLSENPKWKILLLEVGKEPTAVMNIPALAASFQFTDYNWAYVMEKQENMCLGMTDQRMAWPRGRGLGGTSLINYMIHVRGNRGDYERWRKAGNTGWGYEDVLPYFKKMEDSIVQKQDKEYHNTGGPVSIQDVDYRSLSVDAFVKGAQEVGHNYVDYNGKEQMGVSYVQAVTKRGLRVSVEKAYLQNIRNRRNLKISTRSRATKLLINENKRITGVEYVKNRKYYVARASKEVILSAGTFNSPQLLMLSGIGPKEDLNELGIPVVQNLPVGKILYDHLTFLGLLFTVNESITINQNELYNPVNLVKLVTNGTGILTSLGGVESLLYMKTNVSKETDNYPDMELIFIGGGLHSDGGAVFYKSFRLKDEVFDAIFKPYVNKEAYSVLPMLVHPYSKGAVKLKSRNPYHWPKLYGNSFTDPGNLDIKTFIAAIREVQKISSSPAFQRYGSTQVRIPIPGCGHVPWDTDEYWECALRHVTGTLHHQVATCKMGPSNDPEAVVNNKLKVYGVTGLRVVDCSIIPLPLTAHTNSPAIMIGEKAADIIKEEWSVKNDGPVDPR